MHVRHVVRPLVLALAMFACAASAFAQATAKDKPTAQKPFEPYSGQPGKDVVWVPTPQPLVEKMLDMAKLTPQDLHVDLGSGDGRTVITAAKRGARAIGVEFNPDMVALSKKNAADAGVSDKATFVQGDLFEYDFSKANVVTLFLLPSINMKLRPKILDMKPGTRIVANSFNMEDWEADETETIGGDCTSWCTALLWIVPAKVQGTWTLPQGELKLTQQFQKVTGTLGTQQIAEGKLNGDVLTFKVGNATYSGKVNGNMIHGTAGPTPNWMATKKP